MTNTNSQPQLIRIERQRGVGRPLLVLNDEGSYRLAAQHFRSLVDIITSPNSSNPACLYPYLLPYRHILVVGTTRFDLRSSRVKYLDVPIGGNLVGFHAAGGNLQAWLRFHLARLGLAAVASPLPHVLVSPPTQEATLQRAHDIALLRKISGDYNALLPLCQWNDERTGSKTVEMLDKMLEDWRKSAKLVNLCVCVSVHTPQIFT